MIKIDNEFQSIIPALTEIEKEQLEKNILQAGEIYSPLITWNDTLLDGHNRYEIAQRHNIKFTIKALILKSRDEAKEWIILNQFGRRNINNYQRSVLALKLEPLLRAKAEENQLRKPKSVCQISDKQKIDTKKELAKSAKVSHDTISKVKKIEEKAPEEIKQKLESGELTINKAFGEIRKREREQNINQQKKDIITGKIELPKGEYDIVVIDPPWNYGTKYDPSTRRVANPYPEMTKDEITAMNIHAAEDSILWLWTTHKFIWDAKKIMEAWGFDYKAIMIWDKEQIGMGSWLRMQIEFCLLGIKGKPIWDIHEIRDVIREKRREHSRKPEAFYDMIDKYFVGRKLDYFARSSRPGWVAFGNEIEKYGMV